MVSMCCNGYEMLNGTCNPICNPDCGHGTCLEPNKCSCFTGYSFQKNIVGDLSCVPKCDDPCYRGRCTAPNICICDRGYRLISDRYTCQPICDPPCSKNSFCSESEYCSCLPGYETIIRIDDVSTGIEIK